MTKLIYELDDPVETFEEGQLLEVTAQYGNWHVYDVKLRPRGKSNSGSVELTWDSLRERTSPVKAVSTEPGISS
jgi:hypothetical protein